MEKPLTISVPEAGRLLGIRNKDTAYRAAAKGDIPTIRIGGLIRVPTKALERLLNSAGRKDAEPFDAA
jgi:excisionase family DNA binding protein